MATDSGYGEKSTIGLIWVVRVILVLPEFVSSKLKGKRSGGHGNGQATTEAWNKQAIKRFVFPLDPVVN